MDIGQGRQFHGNVKPTSIEQAGFENDLWAQRFTEIPSNQQMRVDYGARTDSNPVYVGWAPRGLSESSTDWLLHYVEYDGSNRVTKRTIAYGSWTNHTTATYA